jgi:GC-rich sequence DNA-binding factor
MSTAKSRNFYRCAATNYDEETSTSTPTLPSKPSAPKPKKFLSFATTKKTTAPKPYSHTPPNPLTATNHHHHFFLSIITRNDRRISHSPSSSSDVQPQAGTYTKETYSEL